MSNDLTIQDVERPMARLFAYLRPMRRRMTMSIGASVANKVLEPWSGAVLAKILVLVFIILFIQKRPRGLFPQKGRAVEG